MSKSLKDSPSLRYITFFYLYIMQGIPAGFALTAIANYMIGKQVAPEKVGTFIALFGIPWTFQFIWGPVLDRFQYSVIGHRKQWVVLAQFLAVLASFGLLFISDPLRQFSLLSSLFFLYSVFASVEVASVDAMAINIAPGDQRGRLNGCMRGGFLLGSAFGAAVLSYILHGDGFKNAVWLQSLILLAFTIAFFFTRVDAGDAFFPWQAGKTKRLADTMTNPATAQLFKRIWSAITNRKSLRYFVLVAAVYFCCSVFIRSYTFYLINVLHWPDKTVSLLQGSWGSIVTLVAIFGAGFISDKMGPKKLQLLALWAVCLFLLILNASYSLWQHRSYSGAALVVWNLADPLLSVTIFPILMGLCWEKVEGSQFTTYLALINLCDVIGSYITGWTVNFVSPPLLGLCCGILLFTLLLILKYRGNYRVIPD